MFELIFNEAARSLQIARLLMVGSRRSMFSKKVRICSYSSAKTSSLVGVFGDVGMISICWG